MRSSAPLAKALAAGGLIDQQNGKEAHTMTDYSEGYRAGMEAAARIVESTGRPGDPMDVALRLQQLATRIREKPSQAYIVETWMTEQWLKPPGPS